MTSTTLMNIRQTTKLIKNFYLRKEKGLTQSSTATFKVSNVLSYLD